jgi:PAS domain S-box-containing protein
LEAAFFGRAAFLFFQGLDFFPKMGDYLPKEKIVTFPQLTLRGGSLSPESLSVISASPNMTLINMVSVIKLLTLIESVVLGVIAIRSDPQSKPAFIFGIYSLLVGASSFVEFQQGITTSAANFLFWKHFDIFMYLSIAALLHFTFLLAGIRGKKLNTLVRGSYFLFAVVALVDVTLAMPSSVKAVPWGFHSIQTGRAGLLHMGSVITASLGAVLAAVVILSSFLKSRDRRKRTQSGILFACFSVLLTSGITFELVIPLLFGDRVPMSASATTAFLFVNPFLAYAIIRFEVLRITPEGAAREVLQMMSDGIILTDRDGQVEYLNEAMRKHLGESHTSYLGKPLENLPLTESDSESRKSRPAELTRNDSFVDKECLLRVSNRDYLQVSVSVSPLASARWGTVGRVVAIRDVTERKRAEESRVAIERILRHDLRNALTGIVGYSSMLLEVEELAKQHREDIVQIDKNAQLMVDQIESYLSLQGMEAGTYSLVPQEVDLVAVILDAKKNLQNLGNSGDVILTVKLNGREMTASDSCIMQSDRSLFFNMFTNLFKNAIEASERGEEVTVRLDSVGGVALSFHNRKPIPREIRPRFFSKYATYGKQGGVGLGAFSAKLIAEALGGAISFTTNESLGTLISVQWPDVREQSTRTV